MNAFLQAYEAAARFGAALAIDSLWQGAAIAAFTWGVLRVFAKANASTRYAAWLVALIAMLVLPFATSFSHDLVRPGDAAHGSTIVRGPSYQRTAVTHGALRGSRPVSPGCPIMVRFGSCVAMIGANNATSARNTMITIPMTALRLRSTLRSVSASRLF